MKLAHTVDMAQKKWAGAFLALTGCAFPAMGAISYTSQNRFVAVATDADMMTQMVAAPDIGPFSGTAQLSTTFTGQNGEQIPNRAVAGIDCTLNPNGIRATGSLSASGGLAIGNVPFFGEAETQVEVGFTLTEATLFTILATPRPSDDPRDRFLIKLSNDDVDFFELDQTMPAQTVDFQIMLQPGTYVFEFQAELSIASLEETRSFEVFALIPAPGGLSLLLGAPLAMRRRR